ncbi:CHAD domain-containing protein [Photobacterium nomapromontoriensis]|uniref:CHAD domain-containing protein n=1 Tax=Photobacterium nomapromontoriensis TaxID=2910237 RepID=UPI003D135551
MSVTKRDQQPLPKRRKPTVKLTPNMEIHPPTVQFLYHEFEHARRHELGIIRDDNEEFLHQYRVSLRRSRSLIGLLSNLFEKGPADRLKRELKTLMQHTNSLRDLDVLLMKMDDYFSELAHTHHKGLTRFFDDIQDERRKTLKELKRWLKSDTYHQQCLLISRLLDELAYQSTEEGRQPAATRVHNILWYHFTKVENRCMGINVNSHDNAIHRLRICCKKLRYLLEYFTPLLPRKKTKQQISQLKLLQDQLGDFNDLSVQRQLVKQYLTNEKSGSAREQAMTELIALTQTQYQQIKQVTLDQINAFYQPNNLDLYHCLYPTDKS